MSGSRLLLLWILFAGAVPAYAGSGRLLYGSEDRLKYEQPGIYIDQGRHQTFPGVALVDFSDSPAAANQILQNRDPGTDVWLHVRLVNRSADTTVDAFVGQLWYDDVMAWIHRGDVVDSVHTGYLSTEPYGPYFYYQYGFPVHMGPADTAHVWIRIRQWSRWMVITDLHLAIVPMDEYLATQVQYYYNRKGGTMLDLLFIGAFIFQLLYILFQWFITRRIEYIYYVCYIVSALLFFFIRATPLLDIPWAHRPYGAFMQFLNNAWIVLPYFFYYRFGRHFIGMDTRLPRLAAWVRRAEWLVLAIVAFEVISALIIRSAVLMYYSPFVDIGLMFAVSVPLLYYVSRDNSLLARFFLAGSLVALAGSVLGMVWTYFMPVFSADIAISPITITKLGVMMETIIFSTGLLYKARQIEKEKFAVQEKLMEERETKRRVEKQRQAERDRLAADLHDDLGATLSSIGIQSDALRRKIEKGEVGEAVAMAGDISSSARETIAVMSDIVWAIKPHNEPLDKVVERMKAFAMNLFPGAGIRLKFHADGMGGIRTGMTFRKNLFLIYKEAVNNCAKYSGASEADIGLTMDDGRLTVAIHDDGRGFDEAQLKRVNGLNNMRERATEIGGTLRITSAPGAGTRVVLTLDMPGAPAGGAPNRQ